MDNGLLKNWEETRLAQSINNIGSLEAKAVRTTLDEWMPKIQTILTSSNTSATDFTLHDSQHAFRVAEIMVDVIPADVFEKLSIYELALLLLSAYLHDIGMTPQQSLINTLQGYLLDGKPDGIEKVKMDSFQKWLDEQEDDVTIPLPKENIVGAIRKASQLVAGYCRAFHVEIGENWIDAHLATEKLGTYAQWCIDLKILCRSHNQGYDALTDKGFDPKFAGSPAVIVHLRYLAAVLHVADVLDIDPERTPDVIFEQREIDPSSIIYWYKDHSISRHFEKGRLTISAEPTNARIHRAIEMTIDAIESELQLVRRLNDENSFKKARFQDEELYHRWDIYPDVRQDIRPKNDAYEYIIGSFRPDTQKLLQLLSGKQLYQSEFVAIRELLQNAFDAVREQIGYERLQKQDPQNPDWVHKLGEMHQVTLSLKIEDSRVWMCCLDDGVGMSKNIISNHLLLSGNSRRPEIRELERRCKENGFELQRTGQFGIGVLSYFMIADKVQIKTKRSNLANDYEETGWHFETDGIGSFGELRKDKDWRQGTEVRLRLKNEFLDHLSSKQPTFRRDINQIFVIDKNISDNSSWKSQDTEFYSMFVKIIAKYLRQVLRYIPCEFMTQFQNCENQDVRLRAGWTLTSSDFNLDKNFERRDSLNTKLQQLIPANLAKEHTDLLALLEEFKSEYKKNLNWKKIEGILPNQAGEFRIYIPEFNLNNGKANIFFLTERMQSDKVIVKKTVVDNAGEMAFYSFPRSMVIESWKGILVTGHNRESFDGEMARTRSSHNFIFEINWQKDQIGSLSVSREDLSLSEEGKNIWKWLIEYADGELEKYANEETSIYSSLFLDRSHVKLFLNKKWDYWLYTKSLKSNTAFWGPVEFPALDYSSFSPASLRDEFYWKGTPVSIFLPIADLSFCKARDKQKLIVPDRLVYVVSEMRFVGLWITKPTSENLQESIFGGVKCEFHPTMDSLVGVNNGDTQYFFWNKNHPLVKNLSHEAINWASENFSASLDPRPHKDALTSEKDKAQAWMLMLLNSRAPVATWKALIEQEQLLTNLIWKLSLDQSREVTFYKRLRLMKLTPNDSEEIGYQNPDLDDEWALRSELMSRKRVRPVKVEK